MPEKVNPELRDRIDAAVSQLGYVRTEARNLASVHSDSHSCRRSHLLFAGFFAGL